jgi:hypothetical protein
MKYYHPACSDCVLNHDCLFQSSGDVEDCQDVKDYDREEDNYIKDMFGED